MMTARTTHMGCAAAWVILIGTLSQPVTWAAQAANRNEVIQTIDKQISSGDAEQVQQAITAIDAALASDKFMAMQGLNQMWLKHLMSIKRYDAAADLAQRAVLTWPNSDFTILPLLTYRVRALLAAGQAQGGPGGRQERIQRGRDGTHKPGHEAGVGVSAGRVPG